MVNEIAGDRLAPRWLRNLVRLLPIRSQFVLSGNICDSFLFPDDTGRHALQSLHDCLWKGLRREGFSFLVRYDPVDGIGLHPKGDPKIEQAAQVLGIRIVDGRMRVTLDNLYDIVRSAVTPQADAWEGKQPIRVAVVVDFASRIAVSPQNLQPDQHQFFVGCEKLAQNARPLFLDDRSLYNPVIFVANRPEDLPQWFGRGNGRTERLSVGMPDHDQRETAAKILLPGRFVGWAQASAERKADASKAFADMGDGLSLRGMEQIAQMAKRESLTLADMDDAVRSYRTGNPALDNPWSLEGGLKARIKQAEKRLHAEVRGQQSAVDQTLDILKRSVMGLTGAQAGASHGRPRGVLFLAGPTGVGKTQLAKALTKCIFGDEQAYIRFDMSEFSAQHADARLLGAPPGYVGYEGGGELTNAVRQRPFSLILFDEIEKAHHRILDKFLQVIEDGRMTDGQGETVYFSEAIIVFTTNLGIIRKKRDDATGQWVSEQVVKWGAPYQDVRNKVREGIDDFFTLEISRPEIKNRLGDNIVVFDFIGREVGEQILEDKLNNIARRLAEEHKAELILEQAAKDTLRKSCLSDLTNGGRGIENKLETALVNPLARALFDLDQEISGKTVVVTAITETDMRYSLELKIA